MLREEVIPLEAEAGAQPASLQPLLAHRQEFLRFLAGRLGSAAQAEDILQNCYLKAIEHQDALEQADSSQAWFYRVLRNALIDHYRRHAAEGRAHDGWASGLELEVPANELTQALACQCIAQVLPSLNPGYHDILQQVDLNEVPLQDFARRNGITAGNATVRLHRARKALKQRLIETCGSCSTHGCLDCTCSVSPVQTDR